MVQDGVNGTRFAISARQCRSTFVMELQQQFRTMTSVLPDFDIIGHLHEFGRLKGIPMIRIWRNLALCLLVSAAVIMPAFGMAADFELFWDPNCNADTDLKGYYIYYKEDGSVVDDPGGAIEQYVALTDFGFDPDNPSFLIPGLLDDVLYCFAVAAWYGDGESGMSNEVCGVNGTYVADPDPDPDPDSDPDPAPGPDPDSDPDPDPGPDPDSDPNPDLGPDPDPDSDPGPGPDPDPDPDPGGNSSDSAGSSGGCFIGSLR
jgi:hypothetical protein